ncbi:MAG TPA: hypothetical protein VFY71_17400 [Planctomycetota bacterium]|nr:hypothetical protein [Planctomycetota bacterium]
MLVSIELALSPKATYPRLAHALDMSLSEVHGAVRRATAAGLLTDDRQANATALVEFIVHGVKYVWAAKRGGLTRGVPTAHGAPPLDGELVVEEPVPVWPDPHGSVRGESFEPLYPSVPKAAKGNPRLHEVLSLVDAIRGGRARERKLAEKHLRRILAA